MARPRTRPAFDAAILIGAALLVGVGVLGSASLRPFDAPELDPRPVLLPIYLLRSLARMGVAYAGAVLGALVVGHLAARSRAARRVILPVLDVLQSVPILGFFPAAVGVAIALFGGTALGVEAAAVFLIFTSMFWNLAFGVYEALMTLPEDLTLAAQQLGLSGSLRWSRLLLPAVVPGLVYNSILSWANGWYFLMASEIIAAGPARYTLPGLGSYLAQAIAEGRPDRMLLALSALLGISLFMHVALWGPLEAWAERFHLEESGDRPRTPRLARALQDSRLARWMMRRVVVPVGQRAILAGSFLLHVPTLSGGRVGVVLGGGALLALLLAAGRVAALVLGSPLPADIHEIPLALWLSFLRVSTGVAMAVVLSVPLAYAVVRHRRMRLAVLSALQVLGAIPATAFFPAIAAVVFGLGLGMDVASVLLVLTGTFFYVAFNVLSGASAIPREMDEAALALGLRGWPYVRRVFVPAILPSLVTGCVTAWGGGWNAIIFSEYVVAGGRTFSVQGIGATLDRATYVAGDLQTVALALVSMVVLIVAVNRFFWDPLYEHVATRYRMEV